MSTLWLPQSTDILSRVQRGDEMIGWRGDPDMEVLEGEPGKRCPCGADGSCLVVVLGTDARGKSYRAASAHRSSNPGWRESLLRDLRDGDWRRDPDERVDQLIAEMEAAEQARVEVRERKMAEASEQFTQAIWDAKKVKNMHSFPVKG